MLNKAESAVMGAVFTMCGGKKACFISPWEIINLLPPKDKYTEERVDKILKALAFDDYFEIIFSERKGEKIYVITLREKGLAFKRTGEQERRNLIYKVILSALGAVLAFLTGLILKALFNVG